MKRAAVVALLLWTAGCGTPHITAATKEGITMSWDPIHSDWQDVNAKAEYHCSRFGKKAVYIARSKPCPTCIERTDSYACEPK